jgi:hypothetical protein
MFTYIAGVMNKDCKIYWEDRRKDNEKRPAVVFDGTPLLIQSNIVMDCQQSRDHHKVQKKKLQETKVKNSVREI